MTLMAAKSSPFAFFVSLYMQQAAGYLVYPAACCIFGPFGECYFYALRGGCAALAFPFAERQDGGMRRPAHQGYNSRTQMLRKLTRSPWSCSIRDAFSWGGFWGRPMYSVVPCISVWCCTTMPLWMTVT